MGDRINKLTIKDAILKAAEQVGEDGKGKDGIVGYFRRVAKNDPKSFLALLRSLPPGNSARPADAFERYETIEEAKEALREEGLVLMAPDVGKRSLRSEMKAGTCVSTVSVVSGSDAGRPHRVPAD